MVRPSDFAPTGHETWSPRNYSRLVPAPRPTSARLVRSFVVAPHGLLVNRVETVEVVPLRTPSTRPNTAPEVRTTAPLDQTTSVSASTTPLLAQGLPAVRAASPVEDALRVGVPSHQFATRRRPGTSAAYRAPPPENLPGSPPRSLRVGISTEEPGARWATATKTPTCACLPRHRCRNSE